MPACFASLPLAISGRRRQLSRYALKRPHVVDPLGFPRESLRSDQDGDARVHLEVHNAKDFVHIAEAYARHGVNVNGILPDDLTLTRYYKNQAPALVSAPHLPARRAPGTA